MFKRLASSLVCITFIFTNFQYVQAQDFSINQLPVPGTMIGTTPAYVPLTLKGLVVHPENALKFDFLMDTGHSHLSGSGLSDEALKIMKYFLTALTIPEDDLWVNLSPYEKDRIIQSNFGQTMMGRDLLAQDYILKQLTASLIYPEKALGKEFWQQVYSKAAQEYGTTQIPVNTFNKVWIVPSEAVVWEHEGKVLIVKSHLKVMLEEDYLSLQKHSGVNPDKAHSLASNIVRTIVLPVLEKEVNEGKNFAQLRQMYQAMILATWYKKALRESILNKAYADKKKVAGIGYANSTDIESIYQQYLKAFKKGAFNYIKEDIDPSTGQTIPRKYFSGGFIDNLGAIEDTLKGNKAQLAGSVIEEIDAARIESGKTVLVTGELTTAGSDVLQETRTLPTRDADEAAKEEWRGDLGINSDRIRLRQILLNQYLQRSPNWEEVLKALEGLRKLGDQRIQARFEKYATPEQEVRVKAIVDEIILKNSQLLNSASIFFGRREPLREYLTLAVKVSLIWGYKYNVKDVYIGEYPIEVTRGAFMGDEDTAMIVLSKARIGLWKRMGNKGVDKIVPFLIDQNESVRQAAEEALGYLFEQDIPVGPFEFRKTDYQEGQAEKLLKELEDLSKDGMKPVLGKEGQEAYVRINEFIQNEFNGQLFTNELEHLLMSPAAIIAELEKNYPLLCPKITLNEKINRLKEELAIKHFSDLDVSGTLSELDKSGYDVVFYNAGFARLKELIDDDPNGENKGLIERYFSNMKDMLVISSKLEIAGYPDSFYEAGLNRVRDLAEDHFRKLNITKSLFELDKPGYAQPFYKAGSERLDELLAIGLLKENMGNEEDNKKIKENNSKIMEINRNIIRQYFIPEKPAKYRNLPSGQTIPPVYTEPDRIAIINKLNNSGYSDGLFKKVLVDIIKTNLPKQGRAGEWMILKLTPSIEPYNWTDGVLPEWLWYALSTYTSGPESVNPLKNYILKKRAMAILMEFFNDPTKVNGIIEGLAGETYEGALQPDEFMSPYMIKPLLKILGIPEGPDLESDVKAVKDSIEPFLILIRDIKTNKEPIEKKRLLDIINTVEGLKKSIVDPNEFSSVWEPDYENKTMVRLRKNISPEDEKKVLDLLQTLPEEDPEVIKFKGLWNDAHVIDMNRVDPIMSDSILRSNIHSKGLVEFLKDKLPAGNKLSASQIKGLKVLSKDQIGELRRKLAHDFINFSDDQLRGLNNTLEGQKFKREILEHFLPKETPSGVGLHAVLGEGIDILLASYPEKRLAIWENALKVPSLGKLATEKIDDMSKIDNMSDKMPEITLERKRAIQRKIRENPLEYPSFDVRLWAESGDGLLNFLRHTLQDQDLFSEAIQYIEQAPWSPTKINDDFAREINQHPAWYPSDVRSWAAELHQRLLRYLDLALQDQSLSRGAIQYINKDPWTLGFYFMHEIKDRDPKKYPPEARLWAEEFSSNFDKATLAQASDKQHLGGISLNAKMLDLQIKRDGNGVPLPLSQQPLDRINIQGFVPQIISIKPVDLAALFND